MAPNWCGGGEVTWPKLDQQNFSRTNMFKCIFLWNPPPSTDKWRGCSGEKLLLIETQIQFLLVKLKLMWGMWTSWREKETVGVYKFDWRRSLIGHTGLVSKWWIRPSSPREFSIGPRGMGANLRLRAFWAAALFWKHTRWELPLLSGSRPRPLQSCGWWSVPAEGSWGRGWVAGTASAGQRALRTGYLLVPQLQGGGSKEKSK